MSTLQVNLADRSYPIVIERGVLDRIGAHVRSDGGKVFVVTDANVAPLYLDRVLRSVERAGYRTASLVLEAGEPTKSFQTLPTVYGAMLEFGLTRSDCVIALGGGVIGDLTGFAAATYLRGVAFYQAPTTLLAQVDSSVGGKVAVDLPQGKNLVGNFYQPKAVWIDPDVLETLSDAYFRDGMGEVIKYGCICDAALFDRLDRYRDRDGIRPHLEQVIYDCCDIKRAIVERDERDKGERMLLNFGHTYGHALEQYYGFIGLTHGQAVAAGMCYILESAQARSLTPQGALQRLRKVLQSYGLPISDPAPAASVVGAIANDKKNLGKDLTVVLLREIGQGYLYKTNTEFFKTWN